MVMETSEPPGQHKKSGLHWLDLIVSVCALFTSAVSILMAYQNSNAMEDLVHANSWPFLQLSSGNAQGADDQTLIFTASNAGTGPARIYQFEFLVDGHPVDGANLFVNVARACCRNEFDATIADQEDPLAAIGMVQTRRITTTMLAAHEEATALVWARTPQNAALWDAMDHARQTGRISMHACYCSVFDECWDARASTLPTPRNEMCATPPRNESVNN